jgi:hypothetical protein
MAIELYAGTLTNFNDSMAKAIEDALTNLIGPLPSAPPAVIQDRRVLFVAIAEGVINHLKAKQEAFVITVDIGPSDVEVTPVIQVKT